MNGSTLCRRCKSVFEAIKRTMEFCSVTCARLGLPPEEREQRRRERRQRKNHRRRARLHGVISEAYTLKEIAERDNFECKLCETPVDMTLRVPDRDAPTIDHVIPFADGGVDARWNVQLAHLHCNQAKGNRS